MDNMEGQHNIRPPPFREWDRESYNISCCLCEIKELIFIVWGSLSWWFHHFHSRDVPNFQFQHTERSRGQSIRQRCEFCGIADMAPVCDSGGCKQPQISSVRCRLMRSGGEGPNSV
jgi:hypothetical protein